MNARQMDIMVLEAEDWVRVLFAEFWSTWLGARAEEEPLDEELEVEDDGEEEFEEESEGVQSESEINSEEEGD